MTNPAGLDAGTEDVDVFLPDYEDASEQPAEVFVGLSGFPRETTVESVGAMLLYMNNEFAPETDSRAEPDAQAVSVHDVALATRAGLAGSEDLYELLGLAQRVKATAEDIRRAYRDLCLRFHPDTLKINVPEAGESDALFKGITKAFDTLSDPQRRRVYDSRDGPTIRVPTAGEGDFYREFGEAFKRAAYWSVRTPVPRLGDDNTPDEAVDAFYDFWFNFSSWRDWSFDAEHDVAKAEGRDERRWMERENERIAAKKKREEMLRINQLVETAYKADPRLRRRRERERAAREAERAAKQAALRQAEEERLRRAAEEAQRAAEAAEAARREKERLKREARRQRKRVRDAMVSRGLTGGELDEKSVDATCARLSPDEVGALADALERGDAEPLRDAVRETARLAAEEARAKAEAATAAAAAAAAREAEAKAAAARPWTAAEERLLVKAINKFPGGTSERWERIAEYVGTRTPKEVQEMASQLRAGARQSASAFQRAMEERKIKREAVSDGPTVDYDRAAPPGPPPAPAPAPAPAPPAASQTATPAPAPIGKAATVAAAPAAADETGGVWSAEQQKALEAGLRKFPASVPNRWEQIAADVPGKSMRDCMLRFQELCRRVKAAKEAAAGGAGASKAPAK